MKVYAVDAAMVLLAAQVTIVLKHELRAEFKRANQIIETVKTDPKFMDAMSGEKQRIFTFELFGVKWKAKLDSYNPGKAITDLKVVARMDMD